jgi:restriction system protein
LYNIHWRDFEHLVAHILEKLGYKIELTRGSKDGGVDIFSRKTLDIGSILTIVQCKAIKEGSKVGIDTVKTLYANANLYNASNGILATTGCFTRGSLALFDSLQHRLSPADHDCILDWIKKVQFTE